MQHASYLIGLLLSCAGVALVDRRYRLAVWHDPRTVLKVLAIGLAFFIAWDLAGIQLQIFHSGHSPYMLGLYIMPDLPVEELFFLLLLTYTPIVVSTWMERRHV